MNEKLEEAARRVVEAFGHHERTINHSSVVDAIQTLRAALPGEEEPVKTYEDGVRDCLAKLLEEIQSRYPVTANLDREEVVAWLDSRTAHWSLTFPLVERPAAPEVMREEVGAYQREVHGTFGEQLCRSWLELEARQRADGEALSAAYDENDRLRRRLARLDHTDELAKLRAVAVAAEDWQSWSERDFHGTCPCPACVDLRAALRRWKEES